MQKNFIIGFFRPTVPKIVLYAALSFVVPGFLEMCSDSCASRIIPLAGYRLVLNPGQYMLTFPRMMLLFVTAYLASSVIVSIAGLFSKEKWQDKKEPSRV
ncbi:MAG TPA: hypothetical protein HA362_00340 [Nanoarchaeota archaeon]|nr:hypothetical protein [Nanoarchaeota archaeon]